MRAQKLLTELSVQGVIIKAVDNKLRRKPSECARRRLLFA